MSQHILLTLAFALAVFPALALAQPSPEAQRRARERAALSVKEAEARAETPYKAEEIMTLSTPKLVEILEDGDASVFDKAKACQRLAVVGDKSAVPALAALLEHPKLSHYARFGLEPIPDPSADQALREALDKVEGDLLVGVINSIGRRKDPKALEPLAELMREGKDDVAEAAAAALGRIRSP